MKAPSSKHQAPEKRVHQKPSDVRLALTLTLSPRGEGITCACLLDNSFHSSLSPSGGLGHLNAPDRQVTDDDSPSPGGEGRGEGEREFPTESIGLGRDF